MDVIERALLDLSETCTEAWKRAPCTGCPLGEVAAAVAATLEIYRQEKQKTKEDAHWSKEWEGKRR